MSDRPTHRPTFDGVLFDLDGTLLDTAPDFVTALTRMLMEKGLDALNPEIIRAAVTNGSAGLITLAFGLKPQEAGFEALRQQFLKYYGASLTGGTQLFPGMEALLTKLAQHKIPWGIVTNKPVLYTTAILANLQVPSPPRAVVCPEHVTNTKPDPEPVLLGCQQLEVVPHRCLFVGDHLRDIQAGINAGCATAAAAFGYIDAGEDPAQWGATYLLTHADELDSILFPH